MKLSRDSAVLFLHILDHWLPPFIRDSKVFMYPLFRILFGKQTETFLNYKDKVFDMDKREIEKIYRETMPFNFKRKTNINKACLEKIEQSVVGHKLMDIACGRAFLARHLSKNYQVTAVDIIIDPELPKSYPEIAFKEADALNLPFADNAFDTVICAHTLEHIMNIRTAVSELRRVTKKRLIIIVPKQRPYKYTFDLHLHFFPYAWSLELLMGEYGKRQTCILAGGDWFYVEDQE